MYYIIIRSERPHEQKELVKWIELLFPECEICVVTKEDAFVSNDVTDLKMKKNGGIHGRNTDY